jgi:hypothetical protein
MPLNQTWRQQKWPNETDLNSCRLYTISVVYISTVRNFICTWTLKYLISVRTLHALPFTLCYEFDSSSCQSTYLKGDGQIYFVIGIISSVSVIILQNL